MGNIIPTIAAMFVISGFWGGREAIAQQGSTPEHMIQSAPAMAEVEITTISTQVFMRIRNPHPFFSEYNPQVNEIVPLFQAWWRAKFTGVESFFVSDRLFAENTLLPYSGHKETRATNPETCLPPNRIEPCRYMRTLHPSDAYYGNWQHLGTNVMLSDYQPGVFSVTVQNLYEDAEELAQSQPMRFEINISRDGVIGDGAACPDLMDQEVEGSFRWEDLCWVPLQRVE